MATAASPAAGLRLPMLPGAPCASTVAPPGRAALRTALRRAERLAFRAGVRSKLALAGEEVRAAHAQRDAWLGREVAPAGALPCVLDQREQAVLAAHRLHVAACGAVGHDVHWAGRALAVAGWRDQGSKDTLLRGCSARHHGLASVSSEAFAQLDRSALRRLQRGASACAPAAGRKSVSVGPPSPLSPAATACALFFVPLVVLDRIFRLLKAKRKDKALLTQVLVDGLARPALAPDASLVPVDMGVITDEFRGIKGLIVQLGVVATAEAFLFARSVVAVRRYAVVHGELQAPPRPSSWSAPLIASDVSSAVFAADDDAAVPVAAVTIHTASVAPFNVGQLQRGGRQSCPHHLAGIFGICALPPAAMDEMQGVVQEPAVLAVLADAGPQACAASATGACARAPAVTPCAAGDYESSFPFGGLTLNLLRQDNIFLGACAGPGLASADGGPRVRVAGASDTLCRRRVCRRRRLAVRAALPHEPHDYRGVPHGTQAGTRKQDEGKSTPAEAAEEPTEPAFGAQHVGLDGCKADAAARTLAGVPARVVVGSVLPTVSSGLAAPAPAAEGHDDFELPKKKKRQRSYAAAAAKVVEDPEGASARTAPIEHPPAEAGSDSDADSTMRAAASGQRAVAAGPAVEEQARREAEEMAKKKEGFGQKLFAQLRNVQDAKLRSATLGQVLDMMEMRRKPLLSCYGMTPEDIKRLMEQLNVEFGPA
jgi:hypothetical protein